MAFREVSGGPAKENLEARLNLSLPMAPQIESIATPHRGQSTVAVHFRMAPVSAKHVRTIALALVPYGFQHLVGTPEMYADVQKMAQRCENDGHEIFSTPI